MPFARAACSTLAVILLAGACAGGDDAADTVASDTTVSTIPSTMPAPADANRLAFAPVGGSMLTGDIGVEGDDAKTQVNVTIRNSTDGAVHQGHIHSGTCASPGAVVAPLTDVTIDADRDGDSQTELQIPMATVMNGQHIVLYHEAGGTPGAPAVCVAVPAHS